MSFQRLLPCFFKSSCCLSRRDKLSHKADQLVKDELKIVKWIQFMRCTELAMKKIFSAKEWEKIQNQAKFKYLFYDDEVDDVF